MTPVERRCGYPRGDRREYCADPSTYSPQQGKGQNAALQVLILMGSGGKHRRAAPIPLQHGKGAVGQNRAHRKGTLVLLAVGYPVKGNVRQAFRRLDAGVHQQPGPVILCLVLHFIADFQVGAAPLQGQAQRGRAIHRFFRPAAGRKVIALGEGQVPGDHAALAESFLPPFPHRAPQLGGADGRLLPRLVDVAVGVRTQRIPVRLSVSSTRPSWSTATRRNSFSSRPGTEPASSGAGQGPGRDLR